MDKQNTISYDDLKTPLVNLNEELDNLQTVVMLSVNGINNSQLAPRIVEFLAESDKFSTGDEIRLNEAKIIAQKGIKEIENEFSLIYSIGVVMLYSYLEGMIKSFIINYLKNNSIHDLKEFCAVKISLAEYMKLEENEKYDYLFQQYEKSISNGIQYGVTRFETLLAPIQFSGIVEKGITKTIFELAQIRNNILHRNGIVDHYLKKSCPWLNLKTNDKIKVTQKDFVLFSKAIQGYLVTMLIRIGEKKGSDMTKEKDFVQKLEF